MLQAVMNGTEMNAPPAPTMLDSNPMPAPTATMPVVPGNSREGLGLVFCSSLAAVNAVNVANTPASTAVDIRLTICGPIIEPTRMPGVSFHTTGHNTASCAACARRLANDVNMTVANDVATAMCRTCSDGKCSWVKMSVSSGISV